MFVGLKCEESESLARTDQFSPDKAASDRSRSTDGIGPRIWAVDIEGCRSMVEVGKMTALVRSVERK